MSSLLDKYAMWIRLLGRYYQWYIDCEEAKLMDDSYSHLTIFKWL